MIARVRKTSLIGFLMILGLTFLLTAGEAVAQIRPAYTKNVDERGRIPYQQRASQIGFIAGCDQTNCNLDLPPAPAGKRLVVEHVSILHWCVGQAPALSTIDLQSMEPGNLFPRAFLPVAAVGFSGAYQAVVDKPVRLYVEPGHFPRVYTQYTCNMGTYFRMDVSVVGYLIDATN